MKFLLNNIQFCKYGSQFHFLGPIIVYVLIVLKLENEISTFIHIIKHHGMNYFENSTIRTKIQVSYGSE